MPSASFEAWNICFPPPFWQLWPFKSPLSSPVWTCQDWLVQACRSPWLQSLDRWHHCNTGKRQQRRGGPRSGSVLMEQQKRKKLSEGRTLLSLLLTAAVSSCTEQIRLSRDSAAGTAKKICLIFKIKQPVQTLDYVSFLKKKTQPFNYIALSQRQTQSEQINKTRQDRCSFRNAPAGMQHSNWRAILQRGDRCNQNAH